MALDIVTLAAAGSFVTAISGLMLAGAWTQFRESPALLWWAAAHFVQSIGIGLIAYGSASGVPLAQAIGGWLTSVSPMLVWAGTRTFVRRPVWPLLLGASFAAWLVVGVLFGGRSSQTVMVAGFLLWIAGLAAATWELWRARSEPLRSRRPLMAFFMLHAAIFCGGVYDAIHRQLLHDVLPALSSWFGLIHVEALVYAFATSLCMVVMCKERSEQRYITASRIDALTGIANRGAFFAGAERLLNRCRADHMPLSVIVFDLDRFKSINDTHGHAVGDRVLSTFVNAARGVLRPNDFFGRQGGEEFAVVLPGASVETAHAIAERVRQAFADICRELDGRPLLTTVSAGVAAAEPTGDFSSAIEAADRALYRAKNRGRNRVERADDARANTSDNIIRVA